MRNDELQALLCRALRAEPAATRMEQTAALCARLAREQAAVRPEPRLGFWGFLTEIFRFEGVSILACQGAALLAVGMHVYTAAQDLRTLPAYIPLFALAVMPSLFRGRYRGTGELEAVTRSSAAQLTLAKLVLAGGADLVCMTLLLALQVRLSGTGEQMGRMILYCLVPYLACMSATLAIIRRGRGDAMGRSAAMAVISGVLWYGSAKVCPWLYEIPAAGAWLAAFVLFAAFFLREIRAIIRANREGKMYGIVA